MQKYNEELLHTLYEYVMEYQKDNGCSPSFRKITQRFPRNLSSSAKVKGYVDVLKRRGSLKSDKGGSIAVDDRFQTNAISVPLVGNVACGQPITAIEYIEATYSLPPELFGYGDLMLLRAQGESMTNAGIDDRDLIVIRRQEYADCGQMVLVIIGDDATVKTYLPQKDGTVILRPENENYDDIVVSECAIQGIVVGCIKTYR